MKGREEYYRNGHIVERGSVCLLDEVGEPGAFKLKRRGRPWEYVGDEPGDARLFHTLSGACWV
jgi:hypothetical protein